MRIAFYVTATGQIVGLTDYSDGTATSVFVADTPATCSYVVIPDGTNVSIDENYIVAGAVQPRPTLTLDEQPQVKANGGGTGGVVTFALPNGTVVYSHFHNTTQTAAGSESFTFQTARMGEFIFDFTPPFPYQPLTLEITANAV